MAASSRVFAVPNARARAPAKTLLVSEMTREDMRDFYSEYEVTILEHPLGKIARLHLRRPAGEAR